MRYAREVAAASIGLGALAVVIGGAVAVSEDSHHEWPWYLVILGTGLPLVSALSLPRPISTGPLLVVLAALILWIYAAGIATDLADSNDTLGLAPISIAVFGVGVVSFFGVLFLPREQQATGLSDAAVRHAFAAAFLLGFLAFLSIGAFHNEWPHSALGDKLIDQLTTLFGVVVAFYFGSATVEWLKYREKQTTIRLGLEPEPPATPPPPEIRAGPPAER
jgi:hypothetical protein